MVTKRVKISYNDLELAFFGTLSQRILPSFSCWSPNSNGPFLCHTRKTAHFSWKLFYYYACGPSLWQSCYNRKPDDSSFLHILTPKTLLCLTHFLDYLVYTLSKICNSYLQERQSISLFHHIRSSCANFFPILLCMMSLEYSN